jgi:hypothetical protein
MSSNARVTDVAAELLTGHIMSSKLQSLVMLQESQHVKDGKAYSKLELQILKSQEELLKKTATKKQASDGQAPSSPNLFVKVAYFSRSL